MGFTFQGVGQAEISDRRPKFKDGFVGVVEIIRTDVKRTRKAGDKLFVEVRVVESNQHTIHPVGQIYSWGQSLLDQSVANGSLKRFVAAVAGVQVETKEQLAQIEPHMDSLLNAAVENPDNTDRNKAPNQLVGRRVRLETQQGQTGNNRDFMFHNWFPLS